MHPRRRLSRGFRKWVRAEKARLRLTVHDQAKLGEALKRLHESLPKKT